MSGIMTLIVPTIYVNSVIVKCHRCITRFRPFELGFHLQPTRQTLIRWIPWRKGGKGNILHKETAVGFTFNYGVYHARPAPGTFLRSLLGLSG